MSEQHDGGSLARERPHRTLSHLHHRAAVGAGKPGEKFVVGADRSDAFAQHNTCCRVSAMIYLYFLCFVCVVCVCVSRVCVCVCAVRVCVCVRAGAGAHDTADGEMKDQLSAKSLKGVLLEVSDELKRGVRAHAPLNGRCKAPAEVAAVVEGQDELKGHRAGLRFDTEAPDAVAGRQSSAVWQARVEGQDALHTPACDV